jgi:hypothetical protein
MEYLHVSGRSPLKWSLYTNISVGLDRINPAEGNEQWQGVVKT